MAARHQHGHNHRDLSDGLPIQNTQNRDSEAIQVKLDELIRATHGCHNALLDLEELEDRELDRIRSVYGDLAEKAREAMRAGRRDTDVPEVFLEAGGAKSPGRK